MKKWVVDASVAAKWFLPDAPDEPDTGKSLHLLGLAVAGEVRFIQPPHWVSEVAAVLARRNPATAADNITDMLLFDFCSVVADTPIYRRAITLAQDLNHHLFDTLYHAVALEQKAVMVTADARYHAKAAKLGGIMLLRDIAA